MPTLVKAKTLLDFPVDTEVIVHRLGPQNSPYNDKTGRVVGHKNGLIHIILDDDPIPRWRNIGVLCHAYELRIIDGLD
jgi:hypothetical protein